MESWQIGRQELLDIVAKVYDKTRVNVETELHRENGVFISRDELRILRGGTARIAELENEISVLKRKSGEQEPTFDDTRLAQEQLVKENAHLLQELKKYKGDPLQTRPQITEGLNKPTTAKLPAVLGPTDDEEREVVCGNPKSSDTVLAPLSTNSSLSSSRAENNNLKSIALETYTSLVRKYNLVFQNWTDIKAIRAQLETSLRTEKDKAKQYNLYCDGLNMKLARKRDKIRQLEEKLRSIEGEIHDLRQSGTTGLAHATNPIVDPGNSEDVQAALASTAPTEIQQNQAVGNSTEPILDLPTINTAGRVSNGNEISASNIPGNSNYKDDQHGPNSVSAAQDDAGIYSPILDQLEEPQSTEPPLTLDGDRSGNADADEVRSQPAVGMQHTSSTETSDGSNCSKTVGSQGPAIKSEPQMDILSSHDTLVVIKERSVKKRKYRKNPAATKKIKVETISSSPVGLAAFPGLETHESIDLDDIGNKQITPRKQRSLRHKLSTPIPYGSRSVRNVRQAAGDNSALNVRRVVEQTSTDEDRTRADSAPLSSSFVKPTLPGTSSPRMTKRRRFTTGLGIQNLAEDGEDIGAVGPSNSSEMSAAEERLINLLENPMQSDHATIQPGVSVPTSDVEDDSFLDSPLNFRGSPKRPTRPLFEMIPKAIDAATRIDAYSGRKNPTLVELLKGAHGRLTTEINPRGHSPNIKKNLENKPVRSRPLDKLGIQDFKINPNYNQGYDYAFTDVIRNHAERRCLPGCTKPECCGGAFRALAEAAWDPNRLPTASQDERDARLLKEFLGDNAHKIRNMTKAERDETLLQAKTRELANKHGRHRHAYERRRSPPGFWRPDFPSTQEEREDREKGERRERELVAQRYNEAMRPGGAYIFRDE